MRCFSPAGPALAGGPSGKPVAAIQSASSVHDVAMPRHSAAGHDAEAARYVDAGPGLGKIEPGGRADLPIAAEQPLALERRQ